MIIVCADCGCNPLDCAKGICDDCELDKCCCMPLFFKTPESEHPKLTPQE